MEQLVPIHKLEEAINRCKAAQPPSGALLVDGYVLSADARALADLYGLMIYGLIADKNALVVDISSFSDRIKDAVQRWLVD